MSSSKGKKKKSVTKKEKSTSAMQIKASIPITISPEIKRDLKKLGTKEERSKIIVESSRIARIQEAKSDKIGLAVEKAGEEISLALHVPRTPVSLVAPNQKTQGEIRYSQKMMRLATRIRLRKMTRRKK